MKQFKIEIHFSHQKSWRITLLGNDGPQILEIIINSMSEKKVCVFKNPNTGETTVFNPNEILIVHAVQCNEATTAATPPQDEKGQEEKAV